MNIQIDKNDKPQIARIFLLIILIGLSLGFWNDFNINWLLDNNIKIHNIGIIAGVASFVTCFIIVLFTMKYKNISQVTMLHISMFIKMISLLTLVVLHQSNLKFLIILSYLLNIISTNFAVLIIYPIISKMIKSNRLYSVRKLTEYVATDIGLLVASILLGLTIGNYVINYNTMIMFSFIFSVFSFVCIFFIKIENDKHDNAANFKEIFSSKINIVYLTYALIGRIAYSSLYGMQLILLTELLGLSINIALLLLVVGSFVGNIFAIIMLRFFKLKKPQYAIYIKFGSRFLFTFLVVLTGSVSMALVAIMLSLLVSRVYENYTDGVYYNMNKSHNIFAIVDFAYATKLLGNALGLMIAGYTITAGIRIYYLIPSIFIFIQIIFCLVLIKMRLKQQMQDNKIDNKK